MIDEYIKKDDAIKVIEKMHYRLQGNGQTFAFLLENMRNVPSADVVERKRGKWEKIDIKDYHAICSCCGVWSPIMGNYCPNCGADMRGADDESD